MFLECLERDGKRYFNLFKEPMIVEMSIDTGEVVRYRRLLENKNQLGTFANLFIYENKILSIPLHADTFSIFDLKKDEVRNIGIPQKEISRKTYGYFKKAVQKNRYIYAFGINYPGIVKVDIEKENAELFYDLRMHGIDNRGFVSEMFIKNNIVFIPVENSSKLVLFNIDKEEVDIVETNVGEQIRIQTICNEGECIWIVLSDGEVYLYNYNDRTKSKSKELSNALKNVPMIFHGASYKGKIYLFPVTGNKVLQFDPKVKTCEWIDTPVKENQNCFYHVSSSENELSFFCEETNLVYVYDDDDGKFKKSLKQLTGESYIKLMLECKDGRVVGEGGVLSLDVFLKHITCFGDLGYEKE